MFPGAYLLQSDRSVVPSPYGGSMATRSGTWHALQCRMSNVGDAIIQPIYMDNPQDQFPRIEHPIISPALETGLLMIMGLDSSS
jgi:hypothetical protein